VKEHFSVDEILEMAEQLERNGAAFYRLAAEGMSDPHIRPVLRDLATWEEAHEKIFSRMRATLTGYLRSEKALNSKDKRSLHLRAMVDGNVFDLQTDPSELLSGRETIEDVLQMAVIREKDSVIFYLDLKTLLAETADRKSIDGIIEEEMDHIAFLNRELTTLHHQLV
jgi:rubrerythrin